MTLKTGTPKAETLEIRAHKTQVFKNRGPYNQNLKKPPGKILFIVQKYLLFLLQTTIISKYYLKIFFCFDA